MQDDPVHPQPSITGTFVPIISRIGEFFKRGIKGRKKVEKYA
jgi:hypothetical protein